MARSLILSIHQHHSLSALSSHSHTHRTHERQNKARMCIHNSKTHRSTNRSYSSLPTLVSYQLIYSGSSKKARLSVPTSNTIATSRAGSNPQMKVHMTDLAVRIPLPWREVSLGGRKGKKDNVHQHLDVRAHNLNQIKLLFSSCHVEVIKIRSSWSNFSVFDHKSDDRGVSSAAAIYWTFLGPKFRRSKIANVTNLHYSSG